MKKRITAVILAAVLAVTTLTGCSSSMSGKDAAVTVNGIDVTADIAEFYARYIQAGYETYYAAYMGNDMWGSRAEKGNNYEDAVKEQVIEDLETMLLSEEHMKEYKVTLSQAEKDVIEKSAREFDEDNALHNKNQVSGERKTVRRLLTLMAVESKVKKAVEEYADRPGRILVAATPITIQGDKLHHLVDRVDKRDMVDLVALPKLVRFAEQEIFDQDQIVPYLKEALKDYPLEEYKAFVLGCTHFNYFKESYQEIFPNKIEFVDGNEGALRELIRRMEKECDTISVKNGANDAEEFSKTDRVTYYFSGKQISAADQIRIDKYMCQLDRMALI